MSNRNNNIAYLFTSIALVLLLQGCNNDNGADAQINYSQEEDPIVEKGSIDEEFRAYVDRFISEMNQRGRNFTTNTLSVVFVDAITMPNSERFCAYGYSNFQDSGEPRVEVLNTEYCWERRSTTEKENLIFHELGHALLQRGHTNGTLPNGSQKSLMCASETCNNYRVYNSYQNQQRAYYLDELVGIPSSVPDWAKQKTFSRTLAQDTFDSGIDGWSTAVEEKPNTETPYEFYIDEERVFSPSSTLAIRATSASSNKTFGHWQKLFPITDFEDCANLLIKADIFTEGFTKGTVGIATELLEKNAANEFVFFARYSNAMQNNGTGLINTEKFEAQVICLPQETAAIRVLLYMNGVGEGTVTTFDNLEIERYD